MIVLLALPVVLIVAGLGFTFHLLWILAAVLLVLWAVGFAIGRGENAGVGTSTLVTRPAPQGATHHRMGHTSRPPRKGASP